MAGKLKTLEHLDGKQVRFSTITSQYPELFVQRKRNTGELIITTDTDTKYGMHHIYAGGEHIAAGYGFASIKTRNDLTYVAETYTGTFKYFNDAYTYQTSAYNWAASYLLDSYSFSLKEINNNSYKNTKVSDTSKPINVNGVSYTLFAKMGEISIVKNIYFLRHLK